jgi:DNA-binding NarL/FixJ family response regulator
MFGSEQESIRILSIEEEVLVREALKALLESWGLNGGEVANADEAAGYIRHLKPDIVLHSLSGNEELDSKIVRDVVSACGDAPLLVLLASDDEGLRVIRLGARSVVLKTKPVVELLKAIQEIHLATPFEQTLRQVSTQVFSCSEKKRLLAAHNQAFNIYMRVAGPGCKKPLI